MSEAARKALRRLKKLLPGEIQLEPATLAQYAGDKWFATHLPDAVALPRSTQSVAAILKFAHRNKIPVTRAEPATAMSAAVSPCTAVSPFRSNG